MNIDALIQRFDVLRGHDVRVSSLSGGLTNENYLVEIEQRRYVLRIPGPSTELLAVDRANELHNARAAATTGISPPILGYLDDVSVMLLEYIEGETMSAPRMRQPEMPARIASSLRRLHAGPRFLLDFDMFQITNRYLDVVTDRAIRIPDGFRDRSSTVADVERALSVNALPRVPCHNDLLAENYIDDGRQLWIIDFEYSGNDDPCFELGDTAQECGYDEATCAALCEAYFGREDPIQLARMQLFAMMADLGWTLWAAIQAKISPIDYDFWGWAVERWERAVAVMDGPGFGQLLRAASS